MNKGFGTSTRGILVIDVGGTHVKVEASGQRSKREFPSGPNMTAGQMVRRVKDLAKGWTYRAVSIGSTS